MDNAENLTDSGVEGKIDEIIVLRPIWKWIIAALLVLIGTLCIYNLCHTLQKINHPQASEKKSSITTASNLDTSWYSHEQVKPQEITSVTPKSSVKDSMSNSVPALDEEVQKAMAASISSNQISGESNKINENESSLNQLDKSLALKGLPQKNPSPYLLQAGTIIPGILLSGINSDLPGQVSALVRNSVYDSVLGKYVLIPQGAKLIGSYDAKICFGQKRVFLLWERIILPNGDSIPLGEMPGSDTQGYSGFKDQVDSHYASLFASSILMSILSSGAQMVSPHRSKEASSPTTVNEALAESLGLHLAETGSELISKRMEVQPTLNIRQGYLFNITVTKDIIFDGPYSS